MKIKFPQVSDLIDHRETSAELRVVPYVIYHFEVSAREERGLGRVDYNRAPVITFQARKKMPFSRKIEKTKIIHFVSQTSKNGGGPVKSKQVRGNRLRNIVVFCGKKTNHCIIQIF